MKQNAREHAACTIRVEHDGRIFVHNLTPALAAVLAELNPDDEAMRARAGGARKIKIKSRIKSNITRTNGSGGQTPEQVNDKRRTANE